MIWFFQTPVRFFLMLLWSIFAICLMKYEAYYLVYVGDKDFKQLTNSLIFLITYVLMYLDIYSKKIQDPQGDWLLIITAFGIPLFCYMNNKISEGVFRPAVRAMQINNMTT